MTESPTTLEYSPTPAGSHVDRIRTLAEAFNRLTIGVVILFASHFLIVAGPFALIAFVVALVLIFGAVSRTLTAMSVSTTGRVVRYLLLLVPLVNVITLAVLVFKSNNIMQNAGLRVGLFGVERHELDRFVNEQQDAHMY